MKSQVLVVTYNLCKPSTSTISVSLYMCTFTINVHKFCLLYGPTYKINYVNMQHDY